MKIKYLFLLLMLLMGFSSCEDDSSEDTPSLKVSQSTFDIDELKSTVNVDIVSTSAWSIHSNADWCTPDKTKGEGNAQITISLSGNQETVARKAEITVISEESKQVIKISQDGASDYKLPVVFHVLYKDKADPLQYVSQSRLADILSIVNMLYKGTSQTPNMNLEFMLANINPDGEPMNTPGVEYIQWPESYPIDCEEFMFDDLTKGGKGYVKYLWDPNKYINVMIYNFTQDPVSNTTTLGVSHLPYTTTGNNFLAGLNEVKYSHLEVENLNFPYCASINSLYIDHQSTVSSYNTSDITVTLAHELGHYLGLHHTFSETKEGDLINTCKDTDYCEDTPSYDKQAYDVYYNWAMSAESTIPDEQLFPSLVKREDCSGTRFISHNIMDYAISYSDQFSQDQRDRIRHVLTYSPLIPGPKKGQTQTRTAAEGPLDLPILIRK